MKAVRRTLFHDLVGLVLPRCCAGCDRPLMRAENCICLHCLQDLPRTRFHDDPWNRVEQLFFGRFPFTAASAFLQFTRDGMVQRMLHRLKYQGDRPTGIELGNRMALELMTSARFSSVDTIMAVPLHPRKLHQRGYNQAQVLVDGMREVWPLRDPGAELLRIVRTTTQTRKGRMDRWRNVEDAFQLGDPGALRDAHVLLVDDVITTGATIEACARRLQDVPGIRISVFTCACA